VAGRVSIGIPVKEPVPVGPAMIGCRAARAHKKLGIRKGHTFGKDDVKRLQANGVTEYYVVHGRSPDQLKHFRLMRRSDEYTGEFVEDPSLYDQYDLPKKPTRIPIIFPIHNEDRVLIENMRNWDNRNGKMFCSSGDFRFGESEEEHFERIRNGGMTARRAVIENGNYTGKYKEMACSPFYKTGRNICPFRDHSSKKRAALPCQYRMRLFFNILSEDPSTIDFGAFFKFETSSPNSGKQIKNTLRDMYDKYGTIGFVPCELVLQFDKRVSPEGHKTEQPTVSISASFEVREKFQEVVNRVRKVDQMYMRKDIRVEDDTSQEAIDNEFRPEMEAEKMAREGLIEEDTRSHGEVNHLHMAEDETFEEKLKHLEALARQLPPEKWQSFLSKKANLSPDNIDQMIKNTQTYLDQNLSEEDREENVEINSAEEQS
jgi:hypothetical protein